MPRPFLGQIPALLGGDFLYGGPLMSVSQPWLALRWRWERQLLPARPLLSAQLIAALPPLSLLSSLSKCTWSQSIASHPGNNSQRRRCLVFFVLSELEGPAWACTHAYHPLGARLGGTAFSSEMQTFGQRGRQGPAVRFGQNVRQWLKDGVESAKKCNI